MHVGRNALGIAIAAMVGIAACDGGTFMGPEGGEALVQVSSDVGGLSVAGVSVEVSGPGIGEPIVVNLPITDGVASGQVKVLAGSDRAFLIRAFDTQGIETHRGGDTLDIGADAMQSLSVTLAPLTGDVDVDARVGEYSISVALPDTVIAVGATVQATATVVDAHGDTLQNPAVVWGSSNPSVASAGTDGLIEGLVTGAAKIGASFKGFGGSAGVTVQ